MAYGKGKTKAKFREIRIKGTKVVLESVGSRLQDGHPARHHIALASHTARGPAIDLDINLERSVARDIHEHQDNDRPVRLSGLAIELGPETAQVRGVLARAKAEDDLSQGHPCCGGRFWRCEHIKPGGLEASKTGSSCVPS